MTDAVVVSVPEFALASALAAPDVVFPSAPIDAQPALAAAVAARAVLSGPEPIFAARARVAAGLVYVPAERLAFSWCYMPSLFISSRRRTARTRERSVSAPIYM